MAVLKVVQESSRVSCEAPFPHWGGIWRGPQKKNFDFFHVKMMHFGVFCIQFHRPRARMNKKSNVLESSIALAAVAGRRLAARLFHCSIHRYLVQSLQPD